MIHALSGLRVRTLSMNSYDIIWQLSNNGLKTNITSFENTYQAITHDHVTLNYTVPYNNKNITKIKSLELLTYI